MTGMVLAVDLDVLDRLCKCVFPFWLVWIYDFLKRSEYGLLTLGLSFDGQILAERQGLL